MIFFCFRTFSLVCIAFFLSQSICNFICFLSAQETKRESIFAEKGTLQVLQSTWINLGLCLLFILQHLVMASQWYKENVGIWFGQWRVLVYTVASLICVQVLISYWQPTPEIYVWYLDTSQHPLLHLFFTLLHGIAWSVIVLEHLILYQIHKRIYNFLLWLPSERDSEFTKMKKILTYLPHPGAPAFFLILWIHPLLTLDRWILATIFTWLLFVPSHIGETEYYHVKKISVSTTHTTTKRKIN